MTELALHEFHRGLNAAFTEVNGVEAVAHYGDPGREHVALWENAGVIDLGFRGRLCVTGMDRQRLLNGQVTNNVKNLRPGEGCYATLVTAKGRIQSDLNIYCLEQEFLLDFEPGLSTRISQRLEQFIIADDVQIADVAPHYGLLAVQGPKSAEVIRGLQLGLNLPTVSMSSSRANDPTLGEIYCMKHPRGNQAAFDLFVPTSALAVFANKVLAAAESRGGCVCGWQAWELARIETGTPRFGADMDESNIAPEAGIEDRAISYNKGCYIGQEVIARLRTYGQVTKALRGIRLADGLKDLPRKGDKLFVGDKEAGYITSAAASPIFNANLALGYVRKEHNQIGTTLTARTSSGEFAAKIVPLPFSRATISA